MIFWSPVSISVCVLAETQRKLADILDVDLLNPVDRVGKGDADTWPQGVAVAAKQVTTPRSLGDI